MGEEDERKKTRWFLVEHKDCGAIFTIDSKQFIKAYENEKEFKCPNCHATTIKYDKLLREQPMVKTSNLKPFIGFLTIYNNLTGELEGLTIREIQYEELEAIKAPYKRFR